jgi:predicted TIM-barrel fold metal-dependent hydrolase
VAGLSPVERNDIMGGNAARLLGIKARRAG